MDANIPAQSDWRFLTRFGWAWIIGIGIVFLAALILGWFDDATELTPSHDDMLELCFIVAGVMALLSAIIIFFQARNVSQGRRIGMAISIALLAFLSFFLMGSASADLIEGRIDFPPTKTKTYPTLIAISRAYQTHGKGRSWTIQTMPFWSDIDVTEQDYGFMLAHRKPGDDPSDADEISSRGYFCAKVTMEQSRDALRVMHAGRGKLPEGSVIVCPPGVKTLGY